jgi:bifunctional N-acetylglucosamine-1-phosphate-uridyltransferase/glucosamine-1-phosphate-acetyltransferase GlmU-like protein
MRSDSAHKVCFEVGGVPVILRTLHTYQQCGISHHIIVIGAQGDQVISTVGKHFSNVSFAYQPTPRGTGNAARYGAQVLKDVGYRDLVLVVVGDRILAPRLVR